MPELDDYDLICFTSPTGVDALFERLHTAGLDSRAFPSRTQTRIAAIGPATARALRHRGIETDVMPSKAVGEALADALGNVPVTRALVTRARDARDVVPDALQARGAEVDVVPVYETVVELLNEEQIAAVAAADYITFTSASTVRNFFASVGGPEAWLARGPSPPTGGEHRPGHQRRAAQATACHRTSRPRTTTSTVWSRRSSARERE